MCPEVLGGANIVLHCCIEKEMWCKRPCPVALLKVMALSVIHLQPLRLVLLDALMTDYMALVDSYLKSSQYEPGELENLTMVSTSKSILSVMKMCVFIQ